MGLVRFASGAAATITNSVNCPRQETYVRFDLQRATIEGCFLYGFDTTDWRIEPGEVAVDPETLDAWRRFPPNRRADHKAQLDVLLDDMRAGRRPLTSGDDDRHSHRQHRVNRVLGSGTERSDGGGGPHHVAQQRAHHDGDEHGVDRVASVDGERRERQVAHPQRRNCHERGYHQPRCPAHLRLRSPGRRRRSPGRAR